MRGMILFSKFTGNVSLVFSRSNASTSRGAYYDEDDRSLRCWHGGPVEEFSKEWVLKFDEHGRSL